MSEETPKEAEATKEADGEEGPIHPYQKLLDNPWLLLLLGIVIPLLSYTIWGWIELLLVEPAKLP